MSFILILGLAAVFGVFVLIVLARFLRNVQPDEGELAQDLKELKAKISSFKGGFVPWTANISASDIDQILEREGKRTGNGVFLSDEGQPIFAYAFRKYIGPGENALCYILSLEHEFVFRTTTKGTELTLDGKKLGLLRSNGSFYNLMNDEVAQIQRQGAQGTGKIYLGNLEAAKIALPESFTAGSALELHAELTPNQAVLVRGLAIYELVEQISDRNG